MRALSSILILAAFGLSGGEASAQGRRDPRPAAKPAEPAAPAIFPCRTAEEVCHLGVVVGSQVAVLFSTAPNARGIDAKPVDALDAAGAKLALSSNEGRVVMLTGLYDPKVGITKAELVEVASPLASLVVKAQLGGGADHGSPPKSAGARRP